MGREIAQVMGHQGADWLERPDRATEEQPQKMVAALGLKSTDVVADIGAGTGYISQLLARQVPEGKVLAVDVQPEMVELLQQRIKKARSLIFNHNWAPNKVQNYPQQVSISPSW